MEQWRVKTSAIGVGLRMKEVRNPQARKPASDLRQRISVRAVLEQRRER